MRKSRKAQLQMGENVIVLVVFFFLLVIAVLFYAKIQKSNISTKSIELKKISSVDLKTFVANIPELKCVKSGDVSENCIDLVNVKALNGYWSNLSSNSKEKAYFDEKFGYANITVREFDPLSNKWVGEWGVYFSKPNSTKAVQRLIFPVTLYNPLEEDYDYGEIVIEAYYLS